MHTRIIFYSLLACCVFLSAKCNTENTKPQETPQDNVVENVAPPSTPMDSTLPPVDPGLIKIDLSYVKEKIDSLSKLIEKFPEESDYYLQRGDFKLVAKDVEGACADYQSAKKYGNRSIQSLIDKNCK